VEKLSEMQIHSGARGAVRNQTIDVGIDGKMTSRVDRGQGGEKKRCCDHQLGMPNTIDYRAIDPLLQHCPAAPCPGLVAEAKFSCFIVSGLKLHCSILVWQEYGFRRELAAGQGALAAFVNPCAKSSRQLA
jgi:hypothetical protein